MTPFSARAMYRQLWARNRVIGKFHESPVQRSTTKEYNIRIGQPRACENDLIMPPKQIFH